MSVPAPASRSSAREADPLLTPAEVAAIFRVDPKTVTRWAASGRLKSIRTPGGHRRFRKSAVDAMLRDRATGELPVLPDEQALSRKPVNILPLASGGCYV